MRVAVDATALLGRPTGVGVMTREVIRGLAARPDVVASAFALSWRGRGDLQGQLPPGVRAVRRPMAARPLRTAWLKADLPPIEAWTGTVDVVHGPNFVVPPARRAVRVMTIHDLTFVRYPELCTRDTLGYPPLIRRAVAGGAWVHAVSDFVAAEVVETFGVATDRVVVVPNGGIGDPVAGDPARGQERAGSATYVLAVGTVEPRKDLPTLVRAFASLDPDAPDDLHLVIAGPDGWGVDALQLAIDECDPDTRSRIRRLGWVDDDVRADLLAGAAALAYPSLYEGFGIVPLEAMAAGTPVVTTTVGALPETVGDAALLVAPHDVDALSGALQQVLTDDDLRAELIRKGHHRVRSFSWTATTDGIVDLYQRALDAR